MLFPGQWIDIQFYAHHYAGPSVVIQLYAQACPSLCLSLVGNRITMLLYDLFTHDSGISIRAPFPAP